MSHRATVCVLGLALVGAVTCMTIVMACASSGPLASVAVAMGFVSISYFDQMYVLFYILVGAMPGLVNSRSELEKAEEIEESYEMEHA